MLPEQPSIVLHFKLHMKFHKYAYASGSQRENILSTRLREYRNYRTIERKREGEKEGKREREKERKRENKREKEGGA